MKHLFIFILGLGLFTSITSNAQELFNASMQAVPQSDTYDGQPVIYIENMEEKPNTLPEFNPIPFTFAQDFDIKTPFGQKTVAAFVAHTTDMNFIIQVLGTGDIVVEEYIQLVNTTPNTTFSRTLPRIKDIAFFLTKAEKDGMPVQMKLSQNNEGWTITDTVPLSLGVHRFKISYLLKNGLITEGGLSALKLSLTGINWPLPVERFSALVLFPQKTALFKKELTFGKNEVIIPDATTTKVDSNGTTFYTLTHPLPAHADVRISMDFDKNVLSVAGWYTQLLEQLNHILFFLGLIVLSSYALISLAYLKYRSKSIRVLKELSAYSFLALRFERKGNVSMSFLKALSAFYTFQKKHHFFLRLLIKFQTRFGRLSALCIKLFAFCHVMRKYILTQALIILIILWQSARIGMPLSFVEGLILILFALILTFLIYHKGEKNHITKSIHAFIENISDENTGFGLSVSSLTALFLQFYPYSLALGVEKDWLNCLKQYKIDTTSLIFLQQD